MSETSKLTPEYYQAYLVRLWREEATASWRVVVTVIATGQKHHFATLSACFAFLDAESETAVSLQEAGDTHFPK